MYYAGIGARKTPPYLLKYFTSVAEGLGVQGWILNSGGADGADTAFENGARSICAKRNIFLPWKGFNKNNSSLYLENMSRDLVNSARKIAEDFHPQGNRMNPTVSQFMTRNTFQVLGVNLKTPVSFVLCCSPGGYKTGGTSQAMRVARGYNIPVINTSNAGFRDKLKAITEKVRF